MPPTLPEPRISDSKIVAVISEFNIPPDPDLGGAVVGEIPERPGTVSPPSPVHVSKQVQGGHGVGFPDPDEFYPPGARRAEQQGIATVQVCVDAKGRLTSDPRMVQGTGSPLLDEGALKLAKAGSGHYRATTQDGQPVSSCYPFRIRFQIKN